METETSSERDADRDVDGVGAGVAVAEVCWERLRLTDEDGSNVPVTD